MSIPVAFDQVNAHALVKQARSLVVILQDEFNVPFTLHDPVTGSPIQVEGGPEGAPARTVEPATILEIATLGCVRAVALGQGHYQLLLPLRDGRKTILVGIGVLPGFARSRTEAAQEQLRLEKWGKAVCDRLAEATQSKDSGRGRSAPQEDNAPAWETILALDSLMSRVRLSADPVTSQKRILKAVADLLRAQAVVWAPRQSGGAIVLSGESKLSPWDCRQLAISLDQSADWDKTGVLIHNDVRSSSWGARLTSIANLMALKVQEQGMEGWVIVLNKVDRSRVNGSGLAREGIDNEGELAPKMVAFRRSDAALLTPFMTLMGLQLKTARRFQELKNLLVGLTRSLTSAIDAKDPYTFGHSERVARIAVELGRELGLSEEELSDIYLTGLLHDIGKIGIRDDVLGKKEPLTHEEMEHIKQHVTIGYEILSDLKAISHLLPGVLYHHERFDGAGYPEGLQGEAIPFLARILAVADSYDAMSTDRPYRPALLPNQVETILEEGAETQWDCRVVEAFRRCKQKVHNIRQKGVGESLRHALDGALRERRDLAIDSTLHPAVGH